MLRINVLKVLADLLEMDVVAGEGVDSCLQMCYLLLQFTLLIPHKVTLYILLGLVQLAHPGRQLAWSTKATLRTSRVQE